MNETTLERLKRLNAEVSRVTIEASDECWSVTAEYIANTCKEVYECGTEEISDYELGICFGVCLATYELVFKKQGKRKKEMINY